MVKVVVTKILHIPHIDDDDFGKVKVINVDIASKVEARLGEREALTNQKALKIFKKIKLEAQVMHFLTKPVFLMTSSLFAMTAGTAVFCQLAKYNVSHINPVALSIHAALMTISSVAAVFALLGLCFSISNYKSLQEMSRGYDFVRTVADAYIEKISNSEEEFTFEITNSIKDLNRESHAILFPCIKTLYSKGK